MPKRPQLLYYLALSAVLAAGLPGQAPKAKTAELQTRRSQQQNEPQFQRDGWLFDYDAARAASRQTQRPILVYFTTAEREDAACQAFERGPLQDRGIRELLAEFVPYLHVHTGIASEPHANLLQKKSTSRVPSLSYLDADGEVLALQRSLESAAITTTARQVLALHRARLALTADTSAANELQLFRAELALDRIQPAELPARLGKLTLTQDERAALDPQLFDLELRGIQAATHERNRRQQAALVHTAYRSGRRPTEAGSQLLWGMLLHHAAYTRDAELAGQAYAELTRRQQPGKDQQRQQQAREFWRSLVEEAKQASSQADTDRGK